MDVIRQGDVLLLRVNAIPKDAKPLKPTGNKVILALGEATGHHHRFEFVDTSESVRLFQTDGGARYLHVMEPANLDHEEHSTARVPVGKYLLPQQTEYSPQELRRVAD